MRFGKRTIDTVLEDARKIGTELRELEQEHTNEVTQLDDEITELQQRRAQNNTSRIRAGNLADRWEDLVG